MLTEEFNERCSRSLQHDILLQIYELPHGPNLSLARTEFGPNFGMLIFIWPYAIFCSHIPSTPILKLQPCRSSICKPSFIPSAVPALARGPPSQWRLGAFIFCWRRLTGWRQWSLPGRESSVSVWLFYTLAFRKEGLYLSFYFPRERLPCWPFRKSRAQHLLIPLGERYIISSTRSVFPKQSIMPQRHSWSLRVNFPGPVKWIKWNT